MESDAREMTRRDFLRRYGPVAAGGVAALGAADAFWLEPGWLDVTRHTLTLRGTESSPDQFRVAHVVDVHLDEIGALHRRILESLRAFEPDLLAIPGDLVDGGAPLDEVSRLLNRWTETSRHTVATLGNWEHWCDHPVAEIRAMYRDSGVECLVDDHWMHPKGVAVAGTDDGATGRADLHGTCRPLEETSPRVLLSHAPAVLDDYHEMLPSFDLVLSGHTHGGQFEVLGWAPLRPPGSGRFVSGFYDTPAGRTYVSRGVGTSVMPARLSCRPELALFTMQFR